MTYRALTLAAFTEALAAPEPTPGGGGAAAATTALAAGLVAMAARLSRAHADDADQIAARADSLRERALALADDDAAAYTAVLETYRLPKDTDGRRERIKNALRRACEVPLEIAASAAEIAALAADVGVRGNPNLEGDAATAAHLAYAATRSAADLVVINARLGDLGPGPVEHANDLMTTAETAIRRLTSDRR